jgi:hypothetical protein
MPRIIECFVIAESFYAEPENRGNGERDKTSFLTDSSIPPFVDSSSSEEPRPDS